MTQYADFIFNTVAFYRNMFWDSENLSQKWSKMWGCFISFLLHASFVGSDSRAQMNTNRLDPNLNPFHRHKCRPPQLAQLTLQLRIALPQNLGIPCVWPLGNDIWRWSSGQNRWIRTSSMSCRVGSELWIFLAIFGRFFTRIVNYLQNSEIPILRVKNPQKLEYVTFWTGWDLCAVLGKIPGAKRHVAAQRPWRNFQAWSAWWPRGGPGEISGTKPLLSAQRS